MPNFTRRPGDTVSDIALGNGGHVYAVQYQGARDYQEDRFHVSPEVPVRPEEAPAFLQGMFRETAQETKLHGFCGATASVALITSDQVLHVASIGDSPVTMYIHNKDAGEITARQLTRDHNPSDPQEKVRVVKEGGAVMAIGGIERVVIGHPVKGRVSGLAVSRAFGDTAAKGVSAQPDILAVDLKPYLAQNCDIYIGVASDGLDDRCLGDDKNKKYAQVDRVNHLERVISANPDANLADAAASQAIVNGSSDNCTSLMMKVPRDMKGKSVFLAVADGHGGEAVSEAVIRSFERQAKRGPAVVVRPVISVGAPAAPANP